MIWVSSPPSEDGVYFVRPVNGRIMIASLTHLRHGLLVKQLFQCCQRTAPGPTDLGSCEWWAEKIEIPLGVWVTNRGLEPQGGRK